MQTINHPIQIIPAHTTVVEVPEKKIVRTIVIERDDSPESPREWGNLGTMYCWHRSYNLGDEQPSSDAVEKALELIGELDEKAAIRLEEAIDNHPYPYTTEEWRECDQWLNAKLSELFDKYYISLPLNLYDHSGITMSTGSFSDPWDSGQVGFIAVSKEKVRKEYGWKRLTQARIKKIEEYLNNEVETYATYLEGDVYGFTIYEHAIDEPPHEGESTDSCWGFYGSGYKENGMTGHWPSDWETTCGLAYNWSHQGHNYDWEIEHEA